MPVAVRAAVKSIRTRTKKIRPTIVFEFFCI
jgi:hypothetical protein